MLQEMIDELNFKLFESKYYWDDGKESGVRQVAPTPSPEIRHLARLKQDLYLPEEYDLCPDSARCFIDSLVALKIAKEVCADLEQGGYPVADYHRQPVKVIHDLPLTYNSPENKPVIFKGQEVVISDALQKLKGKDAAMVLKGRYAGTLTKKNRNGQINVAARLFNDYRLVDHGAFMFHDYKYLSDETKTFATETFNQVVKEYEWASEAIIGLCAQELGITVDPKTFHKTRPVK